MESPKQLFLLLPLLLLAGCYRSESERSQLSASKPNTAEHYRAEPKAQIADATERNQSLTTQVSLRQADRSQSMAEAMDRKILRNADLTLEVAFPTEAHRRITSIAESLGGFVVTSESKQRQSPDATKQDLEVNLVIRVPAQMFNSALEQIRTAGSRVIQEKTTGEDVTEEFIDLAARIKTQTALELQFLEIMKRASKVEDALEVQRQIAEVRTEIEKLEGRKRFLENRASLSTISVSLRSPTAIVVNTSGFGREIKEALADSVGVARGIVIFLIRFLIVMIPIFILVLLPGWFLVRYALRRARRMQSVRAASRTGSLTDSSPDAPAV